MKIAYLDCFAGISGDMFLGALIGAGVDPRVLHNAAAALNLGVSLKIATVDRSGISSTKVDVMFGDAIADSPNAVQSKRNLCGEIQEQDTELHTHQQQLETQHLHKTGVAHEHTSDKEAHDHPHTHGRPLTAIRQLIQNSGLSSPVVRIAIHAFELLGTSEAKIHNVPVEEIHFHEVGAVDAIADIVAASAGIHALAADQWIASAINVGGGMVECAHGRFPVPAPATADLLRGLPTYSANVLMELVTPTGAALLRVLVEEMGLTFGPQPAMLVQQIGYGAGSRNPDKFPNVLRLSVGAGDDGRLRDASLAEHKRSHRDDSRTVTVLETALDDLSPQILAHVAETALQQGALDVMLTPVIMKKGRPGTLLTVLCNPDDRLQLVEFLMRETSTLGVRIREEKRACMERGLQAVATRYGEIKVKLGTLNGEVLNINPEFEDCRSAAARHSVPVKQVQQAAIVAYTNSLGSARSNG